MNENTSPQEPQQDTSSVSNLLIDRGEHYGEAWKLTNQVHSWLNRIGLMSALSEAAYTFNWLMIMSKLMRALTSPENPDHWLDIEGYARLVREDIEANTQ